MLEQHSLSKRAQCSQTTGGRGNKGRGRSGDEQEGGAEEARDRVPHGGRRRHCPAASAGRVAGRAGVEPVAVVRPLDARPHEQARRWRRRRDGTRLCRRRGTLARFFHHASLLNVIGLSESFNN